METESKDFETLIREINELRERQKIIAEQFLLFATAIKEKLESDKLKERIQELKDQLPKPYVRRKEPQRGKQHLSLQPKK